MITEADMLDWPRYNPPGLLIGPVLYIYDADGYGVPDYSKPGVADRIAIENMIIEDAVIKPWRGA